MIDAVEDADLGETDEALRAYVRAKQAVASLLQETRQALGPWDSEAGRADALLSRLAEDRFNLVVLGEFKRGKSSLINAILGRALLPTAGVPLTSVVTAARYGPVERASILRSGRRFPEPVPLSALADFVTERGNPGNGKGIASAEVEAPAPFLRRGLHLVDTPGVGSVHAHSAAVTRAFLPEADAAVFVTSADAPLARSELTFLDAVRSHVRKVFFVVNKMDVPAVDERSEIVRFVASVLKERVGIDEPRVFPLSARLALEAKASGAQAALASSGLPALESALAEFLGRERRQVFLAAILDRALRLVGDGRFALELRRRRADPGNESAKVALGERLEALDVLRREALDRARGEVGAWQTQVLEPCLLRFACSAQADLARDLARVEASRRSSGEEYHDRLTRWRRQALAERASVWEAEQRETIERFARELSDRLAATLAAAVKEVVTAGGKVLGIVPPDGAGGEEAAWRRPAPPFEPDHSEPLSTAAALGEFPPLFPRPAVLGRYVARLLVRRALPNEVKRTAEALRRKALDYLESCISDLDVASGRAMAEERERLGLSVRPATRQVSAGGADAKSQFARLDELAQRLARLRGAILASRDGTPYSEAVAQAAAVAEAAPRQESTPTAPTPLAHYWGRSSTCSICSHVLDALFDFMSHFQYVLATDARTQAEFARAGGFCPPHAWQLEELSSPRGLCGGYPALLDSTGERARALISRTPGEASRLVLEAVTRPNACAACRARDRAEKEALAALCADLATEAGRVRYDRSAGLCLRHLASLLPQAEPEAVPTLLRRLGRRCDDVSEAMHDYALKVDAHRRELLSREEEAAYRQAVALVAGERRVF